MIKPSFQSAILSKPHRKHVHFLHYWTWLSKHAALKETNRKGFYWQSPVACATRQIPQGWRGAELSKRKMSERMANNEWIEDPRTAKAKDEILGCYPCEARSKIDQRDNLLAEDIRDGSNNKTRKHQNFELGDFVWLQEDHLEKRGVYAMKAWKSVDAMKAWKKHCSWY